MGRLALPDGADLGFRIESVDVFDHRFAINVYGAGRRGWFVASLRHPGPHRDSGIRALPKGEWRTLLHLVDQCGFWSLPEGDAHLVEHDDGAFLDGHWETVLDGEWLTIAGRDGSRYHRVHRFVSREWGLDAVLKFSRRVSGFFPRRPAPAVLLPDADLGNVAELTIRDEIA